MLFIHRPHHTNSTSDCWFNKTNTFNRLCMENFFYWSSINILKLSVKIKFHTFWAQIASIFGGFVVCDFISFVQFVVVVVVFDFLSLHSTLNWFITQGKNLTVTLSDIIPQIAFASQSTELRFDQEYSLIRIVAWSFFLEVLQYVTHNELSERGATCSRNCTNRSKRHNCNIKARQINHHVNSSLFGFLWPFQALSYFSFFDLIAVTLQQAFGTTFCTPKVENAHVMCAIKVTVYLQIDNCLQILIFELK